MEKVFSKIVGTPVMAEDHVRPVNTVKDLIIDPENGKLLAFMVNVSRGEIVLPMDVLSWKDLIYINSVEDIMQSEEILRVKNVIASGIRYINNRVYSENGDYMGRVLDLAVNTNSMEVISIFVGKDFWGLLRYQERIILTKDIVEVTAEKIVVKNNLEMVKEEKKDFKEELVTG